MVRLFTNRELAIQNALIDRLSARYEKTLRLEIARAMRSAAKEYERNGDIGVDMSLGNHPEKIEGILSGLWNSSIKIFSDRVQIGKSKKSMIDNIVRLWFAQKAYDTIVRVTRTTQTQIRDIIFREQTEGKGVKEIAKSITEKAPQLSIYRAAVIARTETHGSGNFSSIETAREIDDTLKKEWISAQDERTRAGDFDHLDASGQIVGMNEKFEVSGEFLDYPGDNASASAGNVINCRCVVGYVRG